MGFFVNVKCKNVSILSRRSRRTPRLLEFMKYHFYSEEKKLNIELNYPH